MEMAYTPGQLAIGDADASRTWRKSLKVGDAVTLGSWAATINYSKGTKDLSIVQEPVKIEKVTPKRITVSSDNGKSNAVIEIDGGAIYGSAKINGREEWVWNNSEDRDIRIYPTGAEYESAWNLRSETGYLNHRIHRAGRLTLETARKVVAIIDGAGEQGEY